MKKTAGVIGRQRRQRYRCRRCEPQINILSARQHFYKLLEHSSQFLVSKADVCMPRVTSNILHDRKRNATRPLNGFITSGGMMRVSPSEGWREVFRLYTYGPLKSIAAQRRGVVTVMERHRRQTDSNTLRRREISSNAEERWLKCRYADSASRADMMVVFRQGVHLEPVYL
ncbi:hypothetical protein CPB85DRAFT_110837 [Mucidula mucida]|nr:hypothetical protein CPB85DRAFT_110837 [Mucidula mucida]